MLVFLTRRRHRQKDLALAQFGLVRLSHRLQRGFHGSFSKAQLSSADDASGHSPRTPFTRRSELDHLLVRG